MNEKLREAIHHGSKVHYGAFPLVTYCGRTEVPAVLDKAEVTCKTCKRMIEQTEEVAEKMGVVNK
jgi:hypothetical protein